MATEGLEPQTAKRARRAGAIRSAPVIMALLTGLNLLNYLDRYVLSAVLAKVQEDLQLSNTVGGLLATVFLIGYFTTSPIFGALADRAGPSARGALMGVGIAVWSAATVASGLVHGTAALLVARAIVGVGEASYATIAPTLIDDLAAPAQKGRWMAIFNAAIPMGSALGYFVGGAVEKAHGWRAAFWVAGVPGIVLAVLCFLISEPERPAASTADAAQRSLAPLRPAIAAADLVRAARGLFDIPRYRGAVLGYCAYTFAIGGFAFWAPKYLYASYGLEAGEASVKFGLVTLGAGFVGTLAGGLLADRTVRRHEGLDPDEALVRGSLQVCALAAGLGAPLAAAAILTHTANAFLLLLAPCEVALFLSSGPINVALLRSVPPALRATAMALGIFAIHALGDLWSPPLIGAVADVAPMTWAMLLAPGVFGLAAIVWWRSSGRLTSAGAVR